MLTRCRNEKSDNYKYYGGKGIDVCERWGSFDNFLVDMGLRPNGTTLDRKDNNGNYEPNNCVWSTKAEQMKNRSNSVFVELSGIRLTVTDWAKRLGLPRSTIMLRLKRGFPEAQVLRPFSMKSWAEVEGKINLTKGGL